MTKFFIYKNIQLNEFDRRNLRQNYLSPSNLQMSNCSLILKLLNYEIEDDVQNSAMKRGVEQQDYILKEMNLKSNVLTFFNEEYNLFFNPDCIDHKNKIIYEIKSIETKKDITKIAKDYERQCLTYHIATEYQVILMVYHHLKHTIEKHVYEFSDLQKSNLIDRINLINGFIQNPPKDGKLEELTKLKKERLSFSRKIKVLEKIIEKEQNNEI
jgi:hypothetical protein